MENEKVLQGRFELVKSMHTIVMSMNDENAYMTWIYVVPDEATDEDLMDIAENDELYSDTCKLFTKLVRKYGANSGYYVWNDNKSYGDIVKE